jgi:hypothetical protein
LTVCIEGTKSSFGIKVKISMVLTFDFDIHTFFGLGGSTLSVIDFGGLLLGHSGRHITTSVTISSIKGRFSHNPAEAYDQISFLSCFAYH